jgi:flavin-dependent dehydrogenase
MLPDKSVWRRFPRLQNERRPVGRAVLIGDALRTAHFPTGSGPRPALHAGDPC